MLTLTVSKVLKLLLGIFVSLPDVSLATSSIYPGEMFSRWSVGSLRLYHFGLAFRRSGLLAGILTNPTLYVLRRVEECTLIKISGT